MKYKRKFITAINKLIKDYTSQLAKHTSWGSHICSLCEATRKKEYMLRDCSLCPWVLFEGGRCLELFFVRDDLPKRLERLNRWKDKIAKL